MRTLVPLGLALVLAACASAGTEVDQSKAATFVPGTTTYQEVVTQLGPPNAESVSSDGTRTIVYAHTQTTVRPQSFIPVVGAFVAQADVNTATYSFIFDRNGVLSRSQRGTTQATGGAGL